MELDEYQRRASETNKGTLLYVKRAGAYGVEHISPVIGMYNALALNGEAGELAEKIKKAARDGVESQLEHRMAVVKELGDCLWYLSQLAADFGMTLSEVAEINLKKLADRQARGVLSGSGDER